MHEIWLTVQEVSTLLSISCRAIQKSVANGKYAAMTVSSVGRNGKQYLIALDSLPTEAQEKYYACQETEASERLLTFENMQKYTQKQLEDAGRKAAIVRRFWRSGKTAVAFLNEYNEQLDKPITPRQLLYWVKQYKKGGSPALIDRRGGYNKGSSSIPEEAWDAFYSLYMTPQQRSIKFCYDKVKARHPDIPSVDAFEFRLKKIPELVKIRYREGKKAFRDKLPYMIRDKSDVLSNEIWCSDHHRADVFVRNKLGKVFRPWITVFTDIRSTKVVSCIVREADPNTTVVLKCLREGVREYGIPDFIYTDNGKDYLAKAFDPENEDSVFRMLEIEKITALPYHGQAKPVERFFRTLEERFGKSFYSYAGNDAKKRPEHMKKTTKKLEEDENIPTFEFYQEQLMNYVREYNATPHSGSGMNNKSPNEVYSENLPESIETVSEEILCVVFGKTQIRKVNNNGIKLYCNTFTDRDGILSEFMGKEVKVKYDYDNMEVAYVYDMENHFICKVFPKLHSPFRGTNEEDYERAAKERRNVKKIVKQYQPKRLKDESDYLFGYIAEEHKAEWKKEQVQNSATEEAQKAVSDTEMGRKFNPFADLYDDYEEECV